jgi:hypothetical protein
MSRSMRAYYLLVHHFSGLADGKHKDHSQGQLSDMGDVVRLVSV